MFMKVGMSISFTK